jgi:hypothetical protein
MVSATASLYNDQSLIMIEERYGKYCNLIQNSHDGDKVAFKKEFIDKEYGGKENFLKEVKPLIERELEYNGEKLVLTAGVKMK